ncbi:hypothetical protein VNO80_22830 [Phaseolus coccineus]|uniref:Uncharacterized protein n=1 Tax=Phaseolus coccineus TaxID=3886 RepID=A0AAN9M8N9_PHACN
MTGLAMNSAREYIWTFFFLSLREGKEVSEMFTGVVRVVQLKELIYVGPPPQNYPNGYTANFVMLHQQPLNLVSLQEQAGIDQGFFELDDLSGPSPKEDVFPLVKLVRQILLIDDVRYELRELYGIGSSATEDFDDNDREGVCNMHD